MENEDMIRVEMEETREKLSEKLDTLEKKLVESVEEATTVVNTVKDSVHDSMATVKDSVHDTVATVKESVHDTVDSVKDFVNVEKQWEQHPWLLAGGAVACGYVLATVLSSPRRSEPRVASMYQSPVPFNVRPQPPEPLPPVKATGENWLSAFAPEINMLKSLALGATFGTIRELIATQVPPAAVPMVRSMLDGLTKKMGGEPIIPESPTEPSTGSMTTSPVSTSYDQPAVGAGVEAKTRRW
jgi:ElaB/YqjD/DUF883 family membrane-anchored ribosome-binding protein